MRVFRAGSRTGIAAAIAQGLAIVALSSGGRDNHSRLRISRGRELPPTGVTDSSRLAGAVADRRPLRSGGHVRPQPSLREESLSTNEHYVEHRVHRDCALEFIGLSARSGPAGNDGVDYGRAEGVAGVELVPLRRAAHPRTQDPPQPERRSEQCRVARCCLGSSPAARSQRGTGTGPVASSISSRSAGFSTADNRVGGAV